MELKKLKELANLPDIKKPRAVYNKVIGIYFPGGNEILDICERLHQAQHGRRQKDPMLQELLDMAVSARDQMTEAIRKSTDGVFVRM